MDDPEFESLQRQLTVVTDRVRGVARGGCPGLYLYGRAGTSKTHTVTTTLDALGISFTYSTGHVTPLGRFELIHEHADQVIVLDDVSAVFQQPQALQILLAALGHRAGGRLVRHRTARQDLQVEFRGGIIAISNVPLAAHDQAILAALKDRVHVIQYEPSDEQIQALMRHVASGGVRGVDPADCQAVLEFLLDECRSRGIRPSMRLFADKALPDFALHARKVCELDWRDLVIADLEQQLIEPEFPAQDLRRADAQAAECRIAREIVLAHHSGAARVQAWQAQTGKSQATFYRRLQELGRTTRPTPS